jgi:hypothetical protein
MRRLDQAIEVLRRHRHELEAMGVRHASVFGSVARNEATATSDLDLVVELDPSMPIGLWGYVGIVQYLQDVFGPHTDVADKDALRPAVLRRVLAESVDAF